MKLKPLVVSVLLSVHILVFMRFSVSAYTRLFVFKFDQIEAVWIVSGMIFAVVKSAQISPLLYRLGIIINVRYWHLAIAALFVTPIDIIATFRAFYWFSDELELANILLSIGCAGWSGLVRLLVIQWVDIDRHSTELRTFTNRTPHIHQPSSAHSPTEHPQNYTAPSFSHRESLPAEHPKTGSLLSILTKTPVSTILVGEPGTGKTMTGSSMGRQWVKDGHHVYYIDSKMDEKELNLWDDACSDRYQFDGTLIRDPSEWCRRLIKSFDEFEDFRLQHLNDGKQTICILDELPAVMAAFKTYKPDPTAALNFINRIVNTLPSRNCHILLLAQNPSCSDTLPTGTIGTLKKIILAKSGSESQLAEWANLTMMRSVKLDTLSAAIRKSPIDRGCYYSIVGEWMPVESLIRVGDYNRDTLSGVAVSQNPAAAETSDTAADSTAAAALDNLVLEYFAAAAPDRAKSLKNLRDSSRLRNRASDTELMDSLDRLTVAGHLLKSLDGWLLPSWEQK